MDSSMRGVFLFGVVSGHPLALTENPKEDKHATSQRSLLLWQRDRREDSGIMAPPLRTMVALCAPAAIAAFVVRTLPGSSVFRAPTSSSFTVQQVPGPFTVQQQQQRQERGGPASAVGPLFAKPMAYDVTYKPSANSSIILNLDLPGETTKRCYEKAIRTLSKEAGGSIPGYSIKGNSKHPAEVIERHFGVQVVNGISLKIITEVIIDEAIKSIDVQPIGSAELVQDLEVVTQLYTPGAPIMLEVKMDVWPEVNIVKEYTGFELEVEEPPLDEPRVAAAWKALQERNVVTGKTEEGYAAKLGDSVIANMMPYREEKDGSKGEMLPNIASGEGVDIILETGRYMPGLAEGMEGVKAGETREIRVTFPDKLGPQGGDLEGTKAIFEVEAVEVQTRKLPEIDEEFAQSIRNDLTLEELTQEVEKAVMEETGTSKKDARNRRAPICPTSQDALLGTCSMGIPETLIVEQAREKFAIMMTEFKDQGESDEKIQSMINKESFAKYVEVVRKNTTRGLSLGLLFAHIAEKEDLAYEESEVDDQIDLLRAQAKGQEFDEARARDKIEAQLQREMVLDWVYERSTISWLPAQPVEKVDLEELGVVSSP
ncbi:unnamed protein product [Pylaiella littoralis]